ncbi:SRPBCC family protein [Salaquimonas pukyongi]|uniref:SRPBCC family protein n=1 Tax=Salaquimonas pukyongi TaxID=2712698 RepID=UPI00096BA612|nr:carbon monoxide dehydrogenase subunit G [Salaquimonas pukyongi]
MKMSGEQRIKASVDRVWEALNDPEVLKASIPGCESLEKKSDTEMAATVTLKIGPVKAKFNGEVELQNLNPPHSYTIVGEGKGGIAGFAKGGADVTLTEDGNATLLSYQAKADVGGKIAQLGSRLIDSTSKKLAGEFFKKFGKIVEKG